MQTCPSCKGQKKLASLGFITTDCYTCKGIGYLMDTPIQTISEHKPVAIIPMKMRGRPGRKPKIIDETVIGKSY